MKNNKKILGQIESESFWTFIAVLASGMQVTALFHTNSFSTEEVFKRVLLYTSPISLILIFLYIIYLSSREKKKRGKLFFLTIAFAGILFLNYKVLLAPPKISMAVDAEVDEMLFNTIKNNLNAVTHFKMERSSAPLDLEEDVFLEMERKELDGIIWVDLNEHVKVSFSRRPNYRFNKNYVQDNSQTITVDFPLVFDLKETGPERLTAFLTGLFLLEHERFEDAKNWLRKCKDKVGLDTKLAFLNAKILLAAGEKEKSLEQLRWLHRRVPQNPSDSVYKVYAYLSILRVDDVSTEKEELLNLSRYLPVRVDIPELWYHLATLSAQIEDEMSLMEGQEYIEKAIYGSRSNTAQNRCYSGLYCYFLSVNQKTEKALDAYQAFQKSVWFNSNDPNVRWVRDKLIELGFD